MTPNQYVKAITRHVTCSKAKKKEIKLQLLSDMNASLEGGEVLENIISRIGKPADIAREFNENLSEEELMKYQKSKRFRFFGVIAVILIIILFLASILLWLMPWASGTHSSASQTEIDTKTEEVITLLNENDFDTLSNLSTKEMVPYLTKDYIDKARNGISDNWGEYKSLGKIYSQEILQKGKHYTVVQVNASYENISVTYTITFDQDMNLAGLYMK